MDSKDILKRVGEKLNQKNQETQQEKSRLENERRDLILSIGKDITNSIAPYMQSMAERSQITKEDIKSALSEVQINIPESNINIPEFKIPTPQVTVNVPEVKVPQVNIPATVFPDRMSVGLEKYSNKTPMPVMMVDTKGNPFQFSFPSQGAGGKADFLTIKDVRVSIGTVLLNPDGTPVYSSGSALGTVSVSDIFGTIGSNVVNPDGRLKVEMPAGSSGLTDIELRATSLTINQLSGANWSVSVSGATGSIATSLLNGDGNTLDPRDRNWTLTESLNVNQVSGASFSINATDIFATTATSTVVNPDNRVRVELPATTITGITNSTAVTLLNGDGTSKDSWNVATVTSITNTVAVLNIDSTGVGYSGSNPLPITLISGGLTSTISVGPSVVGTTDDGTAPTQEGGIARTANPTAVTGGQVVKATYDDLGRQVMKPLQVRDLILTAYVSIANGTETTLRAAVAGAYLDLTVLKLGNTSDAAVSVDIRQVTGGNIVDTVVVPPYGTAGYSSNIPYPQSDTGNNWTIDLPDITGTTVYATALFSQEV